MNDFTEVPGANLPDDFDTAQATPLDYFLLLFPLNLIADLVRYTNDYATWKTSQPGAEADANWTDTNVPEMRAFLGINILMGINQMPEADMFWSTNQFLGNSGVTNTMTCNRFQKILQYFHTADRASEPRRDHPEYDRLVKVRPIINILSETFARLYTVNKKCRLMKQW